jgi:formate dehydrogenase major subunit
VFHLGFVRYLLKVGDWSPTTRGKTVGVGRVLGSLPLVRQVRTGDGLGLGKGARSRGSAGLEPRTGQADRVVGSICPYCAVGCGQRVYVKDQQVIQIEGDPDSPISRGRLCPKGAATKSLVTSPRRQTTVQYRRPYASGWEQLPLDQAMEMIADRVLATRAQTWQDHDPRGRRVARTLGMASLGGATLDNEENYLIKKLFTALGAIQIENQARI